MFIDFTAVVFALKVNQEVRLIDDMTRSDNRDRPSRIVSVDDCGFEVRFCDDGTIGYYDFYDDFMIVMQDGTSGYLEGYPTDSE